MTGFADICGHPRSEIEKTTGVALIRDGWFAVSLGGGTLERRAVTEGVETSLEEQSYKISSRSTNQ